MRSFWELAARNIQHVEPRMLIHMLLGGLEKDVHRYSVHDPTRPQFCAICASVPLEN
jgi:hypothetical protein